MNRRDIYLHFTSSDEKVYHRRKGILKIQSKQHYLILVNLVIVFFALQVCQSVGIFVSKVLIDMNNTYDN
jgi:hypothetical protein